jgi:hypothetical protein
MRREECGHVEGNEDGTEQNRAEQCRAEHSGELEFSCSKRRNRALLYYAVLFIKWVKEM